MHNFRADLLYEAACPLNSFWIMRSIGEGFNLVPKARDAVIGDAFEVDLVPRVSQQFDLGLNDCIFAAALLIGIVKN
jgi:hypothetical protein